jgi:hypothetical protein
MQPVNIGSIDPWVGQEAGRDYRVLTYVSNNYVMRIIGDDNLWHVEATELRDDALENQLDLDRPYPRRPWLPRSCS